MARYSLRDGAGFPEFAEFAGGGGGLGGERDAAGFAVEAVDQMPGGAGAEVEAEAADEAGIGVALGGMGKPGRRVC